MNYEKRIIENGKDFSSRCPQCNVKGKSYHNSNEFGHKQERFKCKDCQCEWEVTYTE